MPILEETVREEEEGVTEQEVLEEMAEVRQAMDAEALVQQAYGGGLDQQTLLRYDQMAHHLAHTITPMKLAQAELQVITHWDPLHEQYRGDLTALTGLESIKKQAIAPLLLKKTNEARAELEAAATDLLREGIEGRTPDDLRDAFCGEKSKEVTGAAYHPVAIEVFEQLIAPVAKDAEPVAAEIEEEQQGKAEEQIEEEEEKQSA
jgi:hypothetical protein